MRPTKKSSASEPPIQSQAAMPESRVSTDGILLSKTESGEHGLLLTVLTNDHGLLRAFKRISKRSRIPPPDLFDEVSLQLNRAKTSDFWFVGEYIVQKRRSKIGKNYHAFLFACRYALLLTKNLFDSTESRFWIEQLRKTLDAWETGRDPEIIYFKALYLFAFHHGIPVRQDWLASQGNKINEIRSVLHRPLAEQTASPA